MPARRLIFVRKRPSTAFQSPLKSGLPSGSRGAGAVRFGLPSAVRGSLGSGCFSHWASDDRAAEMINTAVRKNRRIPSSRRADYTLAAGSVLRTDHGPRTTDHGPRTSDYGL